MSKIPGKRELVRQESLDSDFSNTMENSLIKNKITHSGLILNLKFPVIVVWFHLKFYNSSGNIILLIVFTYGLYKKNEKKRVSICKTCSLVYTRINTIRIILFDFRLLLMMLVRFHSSIEMGMKFVFNINQNLTTLGLDGKNVFVSCLVLVGARWDLLACFLGRVIVCI